MTEIKKTSGVCKKHADCAAIAIEPVGVVHFAHSARAKHLSITVRHDESIRVAIPKGIDLVTAEKFFRVKIPWVRKNLEKIRKLQNQRQNCHQCDIESINPQKAKIYLTMRINHLAAKHGFRFNRLFIRNQKTRWGSCSSKDNISLNIKLVLLPEQLRDYVILHELVHTKHKNHGRKFWNALDKIIGDSKQYKKQLRHYRLR